MKLAHASQPVAHRSTPVSSNPLRLAALASLNRPEVPSGLKDFTALANQFATAFTAHPANAVAATPLGAATTIVGKLGSTLQLARVAASLCRPFGQTSHSSWPEALQNLVQLVAAQHARLVSTPRPPPSSCRPPPPPAHRVPLTCQPPEGQTPPIINLPDWAK